MDNFSVQNDYSLDGHVEVPSGVLNGAGAECYAVRTFGDCLLPEVLPGTTAICDPVAEPQVGDYVAIWPTDVKLCPLIKRLVLALPDKEWFGKSTGGEWLLVCEQLNPPKRISIGLSKLKAVHKIIHFIAPE